MLGKRRPLSFKIKTSFTAASSDRIGVDFRHAEKTSFQCENSVPNTDQRGNIAMLSVTGP